MTFFLINLAIAAGWAAFQASWSLLTLLSGFALGFLALSAVNRVTGDGTYFLRGWRVLKLAGFFIYELLLSSFRVTWDIVTPAHRSKPGIVAMPLSAKTDAEILVIASLISLTPGTLSLDVSEDRKTLYVHGMFVDDPDQLCEDLRVFERMVMEAME
ncbi:MAG: Na+/H+ antiporter subunit E [Rhodomicrobium sp.]|nr:Na+/H+ antiporter subunit E [Rhodomicrobium sp.]